MNAVRVAVLVMNVLGRVVTIRAGSGAAALPLPGVSAVPEGPPELPDPEEAEPRLSAQARTVLQVLLILIAAGCGLWLLYRLASVVLVVIVAALFAYVIAPLVELAATPVRFAGSRHRLPRPAAIALVYLLIGGGLFTAGALLLPSVSEQVGEMVARAPAYAQSVVAWQHGWVRYYERLKIPRELRQSIDQSVLTAGNALGESARRSALALAGEASNLPWLILVPVLAFFLLKDTGGFRRAIVTALPHRHRLRSHRLFEDLNATVAAYIRAQLLACVLIGVLCGIAFAVVGVPYAVLLGVLAGVLEFIPLVGPLALAVVASGVAALHAPILVLWVVGFLGVLRLVEDYVIYPRLIRSGVHLHPLAVILGVLAGAELNGVAGMFLAVPTVAIASVVYRHSRDWRDG